MRKQNIISRLAELKTADSTKIKEMWRELFESEPPPYNRPYLESRLAYRIQELSLGGLSKETQRRLRDLAARKEDKGARKPTLFTPGIMLVREWHGAVHKVTVLHDGYEYEGQRFRSLSRIARVITGTNWNGHAFFGLRKKAA